MIKSILAEVSITQILVDTNLTLGIALIILGVIISLLATPVTKLFRGKQELKPNDPAVLTLKIIGLILMVIALVLIPLSVIPDSM